MIKVNKIRLSDLDRDTIKHFEMLIDNDDDLARMRDQLIDGVTERRIELADKLGFIGKSSHGLGLMGASELLLKLSIYVAMSDSDDFSRSSGQDTRPRPTERGFYYER